MSPQRYERVVDADPDHDVATPTSPDGHHSVPSSPPPSFKSQTSSPSSQHLLAFKDSAPSDAERILADTFDDNSDSDLEDNNVGDDRQSLMRNNTASTSPNQRTRTAPEATVAELQRNSTQASGREAPIAQLVPARPYNGGAPYSSFAHSNDGVFANLDAKPERGEKVEEMPPSYEAAAADATPPYWETTVLTSNSMNSSDEVYVDGLPVGSVFSFVWNGMISMSFQLVGFLLTYLLHTTHAAKNGSRAGLGITLVQYGFYMRSSSHNVAPAPPTGDGDRIANAPPQDLNSHDFDPNSVSDSAAAAAASAISQSSQQAASNSTMSSVASSDWLAYALMIAGWFLLIRAVSDFFRARRHEQLVLQSPERGLNVPIVADNERPDTVV